MMTTTKHLINWFKDKLDLVLSDIDFADNMTIQIHDEFYYGAGNDCDITIIAHPSTQIGAGIYQHPFQVFVQVTDKYSDVLYKALESIFKSYDHHIIETETNDNNQVIVDLGINKYRLLITSPTMPSKMVEKGFERYCALSLDITMFDFNTNYGVNKVILKDAFNVTSEFIPLSFIISYSAQTNTTGAVGSGKVKTTIETAMTNYTMTFVADKTIMSTLFNVMTTNNNTGINYEIKVYIDYVSVGYLTINNLKLTNASYSQELNGYPVMQITLTKGAW